MSAAIYVYVLPLVSLLIGMRALPIGMRLGVIDQPGQLHKTHSEPTPLVGGFAIALPLLTFFAVYLWERPDSLLHAGNEFFASLTFDPATGLLFTTNDETNPDTLWAIDPAAAAINAVLLGPTGFDNVQGLATVIDPPPALVPTASPLARISLLAAIATIALLANRLRERISVSYP